MREPEKQPLAGCSCVQKKKKRFGDDNKQSSISERVVSICLQKEVQNLLRIYLEWNDLK